jgi:electron transfer flavoprotein-quinone oxidoreductase
VDKKTKEKEIKKSFIASRSVFGLIGDAFKFWRAME